MPAYHSSYNKERVKTLCGCSMLPIRTKEKGPAPSTSGDDILDEALTFFKANVLFRNYEVKGPADRVLVYCTLYISHCLIKLADSPSKDAAHKKHYNIAQMNFSTPGDRGFPLGGLFPSPKDSKEANEWKAYFTQLRKELGARLIEKAWSGGSKNKWWFCFQRRKFLNKSL